MEFLKKAVWPLVQYDGFPCPPAIFWQFGGSVVCASTPLKKRVYQIHPLLRTSCIQFPFELKPLSAGPRWRSICNVANTKWHLSQRHLHSRNLGRSAWDLRSRVQAMAALGIENHGIFGLLNHMHSVSELRPKSFSSFAVEFKCSGW